MSGQFLQKFFDLALPTPRIKYPAGVDAKSDLKLILEIATNSRLKQGQDKKSQNKQIFYCRSIGKDCFKIQVQFKSDEQYQVLDDYRNMSHRCGCEKSGEEPVVIRIYNLMMLKRSLIQQFMQENGLVDSSPEVILQKISGNSGEYFYCGMVGDLESRRKLKKRFDNIVNITIKKKRDVLISSNHVQIENNEYVPKKRKSKKFSKVQSKDNQIYQQQVQPSNKISLKIIDEIVQKQKYQYTGLGKPRKRVKQASNSSIYLKAIQQQAKPYAYPYFDRPDNIFIQQQQSANAYQLEQYQDQDYFKRKSDMHIALNMLNEVGSNNYWPESDNSIGQALGDNGLFVSLRNGLRKELDRRSLGDIDGNVAEGDGEGL